MKSFWKTFKAGMLWSILIVVVVTVVIWICSILNHFVIPFSANKLVNIPANLAVYAGVIWFIGWLLAQPRPRQWFVRLFSKIPLVSVITDFFLNNDYIDKVNNGNLPEVWFEYGGQWSFGMEMNRVMLPRNITEGEMIPFLVIIVPTFPLPMTGVPIFVPLEEVVYTGRNFKDTLVACASFGLNFPQPDIAKFRKGNAR
ncbi:MAG: hypothetical protein G01um101419_222 [Parcubacteria group bacterium Gr01-1014_19]|nr:MAG: hypothetical protein G01um101419_222 [Parcubacteria group bacterium Gr01-1014_19]